MASRIVTISFTGLNAGGGVPKVNRDLHSAFSDRECIHFCWEDFLKSLGAPDTDGPEWYKALTLNQWLVQSRRIKSDDVVIADGFWADGLQHLPKAISHSHGIWSHLTKEDVDAGKQPDMPYHHAAQVTFRKRWVELGKPLTAVSKFIADQLKLQWGWDAHVINNGVDTDLYRPMARATAYSDFPPRPLIIHGVNDKGNTNKGWDHIQCVRDRMSGSVLSLDEAHGHYQVRSDRPWKKHEVLAQADLVLHPSGYEGNSMFVAEALACGVPIVAYDVGALADPDASICGVILDRNERSPERTCDAVERFLSSGYCTDGYRAEIKTWAREYAVKNLSLDCFKRSWREYVRLLENVNG
jgi:glycosyltransferase involved in cell wall biosynthesis